MLPGARAQGALLNALAIVAFGLTILRAALLARRGSPRPTPLHTHP